MTYGFAAGKNGSRNNAAMQNNSTKLARNLEGGYYDTLTYISFLNGKNNYF